MAVLYLISQQGQHPFESHGKQRTWMLRHVPTKYDWVYILEADERMTPALFAECLTAIRNPESVGYYVAERVMFMNHWIRHSTQYPRYQLRLLNKHQVWFTDYGHTEREVCHGKTEFLTETYPHYTCSKGFSRSMCDRVGDQRNPDSQTSGICPAFKSAG